MVHFIKKNPWFLETALALLEGDEETAREKAQRPAEDSTIAADVSFYGASSGKKAVPLERRRR